MPMASEDSRQDLLIEAYAMGISLGWHIHCTEEAPRLFLSQLPFPSNVQEGLDGAGTGALTFDCIFGVSVARLLESGLFLAVLGRRLEKPRRLLVKVGLRISTGLRCWFLCHHLFTYHALRGILIDERADIQSCCRLARRCRVYWILRAEQTQSHRLSLAFESQTPMLKLELACAVLVGCDHCRLMGAT
jgi:hypothetical protein